MFKYISDCCNVPAKKPACTKSKDAKEGLGHWSCGKCGRSCKVKRENS